MNNIKKILIVRLNAIGDVVHTSNTYRAIKDKYPNIEIHYLTYVDKSFLQGESLIDKVHNIEAEKFNVFNPYMYVFAKNILQPEKYDLVINLQSSFKSRLLCFLAKIPKRINYHKNNKIHAVKNYWLMAKKIFPDIREFDNLKLELDKNVCQRIENSVISYSRPHIIINAGHVFAVRQGRTYPIDKWIELGNKLQEKYNGTVFITGIDEDKEILKPLEKIKNSVSFVGKLSLLENSALIKSSDLLISGDSGPLHIASAVGTKCVGLFGSMPITRTGPYGKNCLTVVSQYKCVPCNNRKCKIKQKNNLYTPCMEAIEVDVIIKKVLDGVKF